jgi:hypothetical protein
VGTHVLAVLTAAPAVNMTGPGILVAKELTPAQAAELDPDAVQGIVRDSPGLFETRFVVSNRDGCVSVGVRGVSVERCFVFVGAALRIPSPAMIHSGLYQPSIQAKIASLASWRLAQLCR